MAKLKESTSCYKHVTEKCHRLWDTLFENNWNKIVMCVDSAIARYTHSPENDQ